MTIWAAGLCRSGERALTPAEQSELRGRMSTFRRRGILAIAAIPVGLALLAAAIPLLQRAGLEMVLPVVPVLAMALLPSMLLAARDCLRLARELNVDYRTAQVERYEGNVGSAPRADPTLQRLLRVGLFQNDSQITQWLEVLPASGLVWRANGQAPKRWLRAVRAETASIPEYAAIAAEWVEPVDHSRDDALHVGRRELSRAEQAELKSHLKRLTVRPAALAVVLTAWLGWMAWAALAPRGVPMEDQPLPLIVALLLLTGQAYFNLARCVRLGKRFARDLRAGGVVIVRTPRTHPGLVEIDGRLSPPDEFLLTSGILWNQAGTPAPWRMTAVR